MQQEESLFYHVILEAQRKYSEHLDSKKKNLTITKNKSYLKLLNSTNRALKKAF